MEITPDKSREELYHEEVKKSIDLFEKSFKQIQKKSTFTQQKEEYEKVMNECMQVMQETAMGLANKELLKIKNQLSMDYKGYLNNPTSTNRDKLQHDIDKMKREIA